MKIKNEKEFRSMVEDLVRDCVSDCYYRNIVDFIYDDVKDDVEACADEEYNYCDIKLAIGRVLISKMGIII